MEQIRLLAIPACKMVSSGVGMFGDEQFDRFEAWFSAQPREMYPRDFLFWDDSGEKPGFHWLYMYKDGLEVPEEFAVVDFTGGLYAVVTGVDGEDNSAEMAAVQAFLEKHNLQFDPDRRGLGHVITPPEAQTLLGYCQMDYYTPVMPKAE